MQPLIPADWRGPLGYRGVAYWGTTTHILPSIFHHSQAIVGPAGVWWQRERANSKLDSLREALADPPFLTRVLVSVVMFKCLTFADRGKNVNVGIFPKTIYYICWQVLGKFFQSLRHRDNLDQPLTLHTFLDQFRNSDKPPCGLSGSFKVSVVI